MLNFPALAALIIPIVTMDFKCPIDATSQALATADTILGPMIVNDINNFKCSIETDGFQQSKLIQPVDSPRIQSLETIASLKQRYQRKQGITFETWITPSEVESSDELPIITIGTQIKLPFSIRPRDRCHNHDFRLSQYGSYLQLTYTAVGKCQSAIIPSVPLKSNLTHIVVTLTESTTKVFINGKFARTNVNSFVNQHLDNWNSTYGVMLFSDLVPPIVTLSNAPDRIFAGAIHTIKMYDFAVQDEDASILFQAGLRSGITSTNGTVSDEEHNDGTGSINTNTTNSPPRLTATCPDILLKEGSTEKAPFTVGGEAYGVNVSNNVFAEMISVPTYGKLMFNGITIMAGDRIPTNSINNRAILTFGGLKEDFFNVATRTSNGVDLGVEVASFEFRLIELDDDSNVRFASTSIRPLIQVVNVNDIPLLVVPEEIYLTGERSSQERDIYIINGIHLNDSKDRNVDKVRVELEVLGKSGELELNEEYLYLAEFSECSIRSYSAWKCRGKNGSGRVLTFVAEPGDVDFILSDMRYTPYFLKSDDQIVVRVFDGQGGECLDAAEHKRWIGNNATSASIATAKSSSAAQKSIHQRCTLTMSAIYIPKPEDAKRYPGEEKKIPKRNSIQKVWDNFFSLFNNNYILVGILGISILLVLIVVVCCCLRCRAKKRGQKGRSKNGCSSQTTAPSCVNADEMA